MALFLRSNSSFLNPLPGNPLLPVEPFTSDSFNRANASTMGSTDAALGGTPKPWVGMPAAFAIRNKGAALVQPAGAFFVGIAAASEDITTTFRITSMPIGAGIFLDVRRPLAAISPTQDAIRLFLNGNGIMEAQKRINASSTSLGSPFPFAVGSTVGLRVRGTSVEILMDDKSLVTHTVNDAALQGIGHIGFSGSNTVTEFGFDDFIVSPA